MAARLFSNDGRSRYAVAFLRITTGVMFAVAVQHKLTALWHHPGWKENMLAFINAQQNTAAWWRSVLDGVVIPNADVFAYLTAFGEAAIAIALIFGFLTRPAIVFAILYALSMMFTKGNAFWTPSSDDPLYVLILASLFFMKPGETLGLDAWIKRKFPKLPI